MKSEFQSICRWRKTLKLLTRPILNALNVDTLELDHLFGSDSFVNEQENSVFDFSAKRSVYSAATLTADSHEIKSFDEFDVADHATRRRAQTSIMFDDTHHSITTFPTTTVNTPSMSPQNGYIDENVSFGISISVALYIFRRYFKIQSIFVGNVETKRQSIHVDYHRDCRSSICLLHSV